MPVVVLGAGVRRALTDRWGLQIDGRVLIGPSTTQVTLDATPAVQPGSPADFIESFTYPSVQFSNAASTGRRSSLSGPSLQGANFFNGDGIETRVLVTAGLFCALLSRSRTVDPWQGEREDAEPVRRRHQQPTLGHDLQIDHQHFRKPDASQRPLTPCPAATRNGPKSVPA